MKKTITALALTAASSAASSAAFARPAPPVATKTYCLDTFEDARGALVAGTCDQSQNNIDLGLPVLSNGCAATQIALTANKFTSDPDAPFSIVVRPCLPPNVAQL